MCYRLSALSLAACLSLVACHDATAPTPTATVLLTLESSPTVSETELPDGLTIQCAVELTASMVGPNRVTWLGGTIRYYVGPDRVTPVDSQPLSAAEVANIWGDGIGASDRPLARWTFKGTVPFEVEIELRAASTVATVTGPAKVRFACGPKPLSATAAPPSVSSVSTSPATGEVQIGDVIHVTYEVSAAGGLWSTLVRITGPFTAQRQIAESGALTATRTLDFVVPLGAKVGTSFTVRVTAIDAALQTSTRLASPSLLLVDRTAPVVSIAQLSNHQYGHLAGQYAVGETLRFFIQASDNSALNAIVWDVSGPVATRDSIVLPGAPFTTSTVVSIPVPAAWLGAPRFTFYARDLVGLQSNVIASLPDSIRVFPGVIRPVTTPVVASSSASSLVELGDMVYDAKRNVIYVGLVRTPEIAVLDVSSMTYRAPIRLPAEAGGFDLTLDGDSLVAAVPSLRSLAVISVTPGATTARMIPLTVLDTAGTEHSAVTPAPARASVALNGKVIVALSYRTRSLDRYMEVDLVSGGQKIRIDGRTTSPYPPVDMRATPDRSRVLIHDIDCARTYLSSSDTFSACVAQPPVFWNSARMSFDAAGQRFGYGNGVLDLSFRALVTADGINFLVPTSALSSDGATVFLGADRTVTAMRVADGIMLERFPIPVTAQRLIASPDGAWLVVFSRDYSVSASRVDIR